MQRRAIFSSSARDCVAPVGLQGKLSISTFERGVIFSASASAVRRKFSSARVGMATAMPCAMVTLGA